MASSSEGDAGMGKEEATRPKLFVLWEQLEKLAAKHLQVEEKKPEAKK